MSATLSRIYRHPIKSIGVEELKDASLEEGRVLPCDREWAVLHERSKVGVGAEGRADSWGQKINFVIGRSAPGLMGVTSRMLDNGHILLEHPEQWHLEIDPEREADQRKLFEWLRTFWPDSAPRPTALVRGPDRAFTDDPLPYVSLIGQASLDDLSARVGKPIDRRRFRANLWVEGWEPFAEMDLIGKTVRVGEAELQLRACIERCRATDANIETGERDIDMLAELESHYGHTDLGVFCLVTKQGRIARGDKIEVL
ncbi:MOSC domain-containing protein [Thioclava sp. JE_KL1]|uniref:MOSC domain-containing protein n=1 Tax=Thioclava sp. JE_KL1 TaxID=2651187 RepID=UPI00128C6CF1|nr:MOSC domain-containing protein [Thioclava sp. JE_KL1]MPQ92460.1 MOSC domain-containing protein [Thioclava sp. JE_KL1]